MSIVNIAFSGGVESTALLQKALRDGHDVNVCMINVHGNYKLRLPEIMACEKIIEAFRVKTVEQKMTYPGTIGDIIHMPVCPWVTSEKANNSLVMFNVTQQFATVLGMMSIRREQMDRCMPSTWIGWIKQDAAEYSFNETEFSEDDYRQLLELPKIIGPLSNADNIGVAFRAPLWNMTKAEIYADLDFDITPLIIPNGRIIIDSEKVTLVPHDCKVKEWQEAGIYKKNLYVRVDGNWELTEDIPPPMYTYNIADASFAARYFSGMLIPADAGLEDTELTREFVNRLAPFFARGRTTYMPSHIKGLEKEMAGTFKHLITTAQSMPTI